MSSVVERVNAERFVLLGWSRAILMQLAHPLVGAGVIQHSSFRGGVVEAARRLHHTVGAMLSLTFGDAASRAAAIARIRGIHRGVHGALSEAVGKFPAGTPYSAEDPALLLWVHATLVDSTADVYQRLVGPLSSAELDRLCVESAPVLAELGGDPTTIPRSWSDLERYLTSVDEARVLAVTPAVRALGLAVLSPRAAGVRLPLVSLHTLITTGLLPVSLREAYGFAWDESRQTRFTRVLRALRRVRRVTPPFIATWPHARGRTAASRTA